MKMFDFAGRRSTPRPARTGFSSDISAESTRPSRDSSSGTAIRPESADRQGPPQWPGPAEAATWHPREKGEGAGAEMGNGIPVHCLFRSPLEVISLK